MRMTVTVAVRASERATLDRRTKRLRQRIKDLGAEVRLLRREQRAGRLAIAPPPPPVAAWPAKHLVQQRMKRAGMRWSDLGARAILHLRCALLNDALLAPAA